MMLERFLKRPVLTLAILGGVGVVIVTVTLVVVLSGNEPGNEDKEDFITASTDGPFITVESAELNGDVGRAHPVRIRVEDSTGVEGLEVRLGDEVVWSPDVLSGQKIVYTTYPWIPDTTGEYTFLISADTVDGRSAEKEVTLSAGCCPPAGAVNIGYTVQPGDDPASIAANFGVCFDEILALNPNLANIAPGDVLQIPYRPHSEGNAGSQTTDECEPAPEGFFQNPEILQNIPRRNTAYPTSGGRITRGFGCAEFFTGYRGTNCPANMPWFHTGIDISLEEGDPITSVDAGQVTHAGTDTSSNADCSQIRGSDPPHNGYGRHVRIQRAEYMFLYAHLSALGTAVGNAIEGSGYLVGYAGSTGCSTGTHLHLEVRRNNISIDPIPYIEQVDRRGGSGE
jgi:murein DD-endopeptidase MepM/ murein hydrolase activator NlpD